MKKNSRPLQILILWDNPSHVAATLSQQVNSLARYSKHKVHAVTMMGDLPPNIDLNRFDAVVLHYSLVVSSDSYLSNDAREVLRAYSGAKAVFIQDEYRHVNKTVLALQQIDVQAIFTCVQNSELDKVYPLSLLPGVIRHNVLTGYVDESLLDLAVPAPTLRPIDIGYRARKVPPWLGELGQEKWNIGQRIAADAPVYGLSVDLAHREEERLYGQSWIDFMTRCKSTLGVESGASVFDFSGAVQKAVQEDLAKDPSLDFSELQRRHFLDLEGKIYLNQISPRCFEAACLKTLMILYEGEYSGRLTPWKHYVPLKKDHSNFSDVVAILRNPDRISEITQCAYDEVALADINSFRNMVREFDAVMEQACDGREAAKSSPYGEMELRRAANSRTARSSWLSVRRAFFTWTYFILFRCVLRWAPESFRDRVQLLLSNTLRRIRVIFSNWK